MFYHFHEKWTDFLYKLDNEQEIYQNVIPINDDYWLL